MKKGTIEITLKLRGEPRAVTHALANGLPVEALAGIRDGMTAELHRRIELAKRKAPRRVVKAIPGPLPRRRPRK